MPLEIPTPRELVARMAYRIAGRHVPVTDFLPIAVARIIPEEMIAPEIFALWAGLARELDNWYVDSAEGAALDRRLADFGLTRPGAEVAYGQVAVTVSAPSRVDETTIVRTTGVSGGGTVRRYRVRRAMDLPAGTTAVDIVALEAGAQGNAGRHTIREAETGIPSLVSLTNPAPLTNGRDAADDEEFRAYFRRWLQGLGRGTLGAIRWQLEAFRDDAGRRVRSVQLEEWGVQGLLEGGYALRVYVDEGLGGPDARVTASPELVAGVRALLEADGRPAGVPTDVMAARALVLHMVVEVEAEDPEVARVSARVREVIDEFVAGVPVGGVGAGRGTRGRVPMTRLVAALHREPGVVRVTVAEPRGDVVVPVGYRPVLGDVAVHVRVVT